MTVNYIICQVSIYVEVCSWAPYFIPLVYLFIPLPIPHCAATVTLICDIFHCKVQAFLCFSINILSHLGHWNLYINFIFIQFSEKNSSQFVCLNITEILNILSFLLMNVSFHLFEHSLMSFNIITFFINFMLIFCCIYC